MTSVLPLRGLKVAFYWISEDKWRDKLLGILVISLDELLVLRDHEPPGSWFMASGHNAARMIFMKTSSGNFIYHACIINIDSAMELRYSAGRAEIEGKIITALDRFVIDFVRLLDEHNIQYVIVSGYVAILFGRARGTEDIDILMERMDAPEFLSFYKSALEHGYDFLNAEDADGLYEMLCERMGIRAAEKDMVIPNMEMKFAKDDFDRYALSHRLEAVFNGVSVYISPIELQILYKIYLGSEKDIEDAIYLWDIFKGKLDIELLERFMRELNVRGEAYGIVIR